jgi:UDP-glucose 4-epimerase
MRVLVTGGAGYVGSACLRWLVRAGHDAIAYDDLSAGHREAVPGSRLIVGDILDGAALQAAIETHGSEAVMHFAALAVVPDSVTDPAGYYRVNVTGTQSVLDAMRRTGVRRIVLSSTAATYAFDAAMPLSEDSLQRPQSPYGKTKLAAEGLVQDYCRAYGIGGGILRYFNASGADPDGRFGESHGRETHLLPLLFASVLGQRPPLDVCGMDWPTPDGTCVRDYVHTDDLAQAHQLLLEALEPGQVRVYNVASGNGTSVLEVIAACRNVVGAEIPWHPAPRRPGDPAVLRANCARLTTELGWRPRYPGIEAIAATAWAWHRAHPEGFRGAPARAEGPPPVPAAPAPSAATAPAPAPPRSARGRHSS